MTYISGPAVLAPVGTTGNNTHTSNGTTPADVHSAVVLIEAAGATPTVTFTLQGSLDGVNWSNISFIPANTTAPGTPVNSLVLTAVGATVLYTVPGMFFNFIRLVSSANTNITYSAKLYSKGV